MKMMKSIRVYLLLIPQIHLSPFLIDRRVFDDDDDEQYMELRATTESNDTNTGKYFSSNSINQYP
jgi:hypothetical protein